VSTFGIHSGHHIRSQRPFISEIWAALCSLLNIQHEQKTAYHSQSNGLVESFNRCLKNALRACCTMDNWAEHLPWVLLGLRFTAREDDGTTPAQAPFIFTWSIFRFS
jgi:transposase InsO family protein